MNEKIEKEIVKLAERSNGNLLNANSSMQLTQAALNLAHVLQVLKAVKNDE